MASKSSLRGIVSMITATASFVACDSCMKLVMADAQPMQVLFMRGVAACLWCLPLLFLLGYGTQLRGAVNMWVLLRALLETVAVGSYVIALARMPIADILAIFQTSPLLLIIGASIFWGERIGVVRYLLIGLGIAGAIMVAQPGTPAATPYAIFGFVTALASAARDLVARNIPREIPVLVATFTTLIVVMIAAGLATAVFETWVVPSPRHLQLMAVSGFFLIFGHMFVFLAFRLATAGTVAPFYYAFTVWGVLAGVIVFGSYPNFLATAGMALIVASGLVNIVFERRHTSKAAPAAGSIV
ncbi:MAG TPA: DMT family transporter [Aestuariivirgaceae bacterium]|jgi:drug/metabolite transporter (DMT)-like permease